MKGISYADAMEMGRKKLQIRGGEISSTTEQVQEMIRLVERGKLKLGKDMTGIECSGAFELQEWKEAFEFASRDGASLCTLRPERKGCEVEGGVDAIAVFQGNDF